MVIEIKSCNSDSVGGSNFIQNTRFYFSEYCGNTSIHGLKFLGEKGRTWIEKLFWLTLLSTSLYFCISLIMKVHHKWKNSPVIVTFATEQTPIWDIPFPSVTICPEIKSQKDMYNFTEHFLKQRKGNLSELEENKFKQMSLICSELLDFSTYSEDYVTNGSVVDLFREVSPPFEDILHHAMWLDLNLKGTGDDLQRIFSPVLTNEGICYSFNRLDANEVFTDVVRNYDNFNLIDQDPSLWTLEEGYDKNAELDTFPRRTILSGIKGGLDLIFVTKSKDIDFLCSDAVPGYKIILNHPADVPLANKQYFRVPLDQDVVAAVKPNMISASNDLKQYDPEERQCYFIGEKKLKFFKMYTQQNCLLECVTNFTEYICECVGFYMPHDNSTPICGSNMIECLQHAEAHYLATEVTLKIQSAKKKPKKAHGKKKKKILHVEECNCLPSCASIEFETETSQSDWDWKSMLAAMNEREEQDGFLEDKHLSRLRVFFKDMQFITSERNQLYGSTDFMANCGGLLGLFTGFSFISLVEIVYYLTLRLVCNIKKFGRKYWSGASELLE
ncbi:hypothetical protein ILUMI_02379 [Ignelater luminosus]|uniref:Pickpocket protein 28 n=1 Tax=Ignelater luminosus TaxID=2038154 RepID=A0A8K0DID2_IGNLU|nr:hypothetical protein ILUMI_02379 [Ignelater luminosus]